MKFTENLFKVKFGDVPCSGASLLHIHLDAVYLEDTHITKLPDFVGVQQLHSSCAFIEVIFEGDAAVPGLDFTAASP